MSDDDWFACPHCGAELQADAVFCRYCGSSDSDGWKDEPINEYDDDYTEDDVDYDEFVRDNLSAGHVSTDVRPLWKTVALVLLVIFMIGYLLFAIS